MALEGTVDQIVRGGGSSTKVRLRGLTKSFWVKGRRVDALAGIDLDIEAGEFLCIVGPSGCGKTTYLRCFNRMHDLYPGNRAEGEIMLYPDGINILDARIDPLEVRMRIGMVFQKPNPFPKSIYENVAYGLRIRGQTARNFLDERSNVRSRKRPSGMRRRTAFTHPPRRSRRSTTTPLHRSSARH